MTWFLFALLPPAFWGLSNLIDADLERRQVRDPYILTIISGCTSAIPLLVITVAGQLTWIGWPTMLLALAAGAAGVLVLLPYFRALDYATPAAVMLMWNLSSVLVVAFAWTVLGERLVRLDYLAVMLLIVGSVLAAYQRGSGSRVWSRALTWMLIASVMYAAEVTLEKAVFEHTSFTAGFGWMSASAFGTTVLMIVMRLRSRRVLIDAVRSRAPLLVGNELLDLVAVTARARATSLGPVSLVNAIGGLQPLAVILFTVLGAALRIRGIRRPQRAEFLRIVIATGFTVCGLALIRSVE